MITPNQQKWLDALRSGKYKQGFDKWLRDNNNCYCPYGVLADVSGLGAWNKQVFAYSYFINGNELVSLPYFELLYWASLPESGDKIGIMVMNDMDRLSFSQIADKIEEYLNAQPT